MARYSAFVLDLKTTCCFFADQERRLGPRKMPKPVVEQRSSGFPAQLESQNPVSWSSPEVLTRHLSQKLKMIERSKFNYLIL
jgi:hypothetical protein